MTNKMLSKSDYMKAIDCFKALWLKKNRKDLKPEIDVSTQRRFDNGNIVQDIARDYFPGGVMVKAQSWDVINGSILTKELSKKHDILFEAFAKTDENAFARIDVLKKNKDKWDLVEIKSTSSVKPEHFKDLAFQKYIFESAGYPVKKCWVLHLNPDYIRKGKLNINKLFQIEDVTKDVAAVYSGVPALIDTFMKIQAWKKEPETRLHKKCLDCEYFYYCGKDVPEYSVFNLLNQPEADVFYAETGKLEIKDVPASTCSNLKQLIDRESHLTQEIHKEPDEIRKWLAKLEYPLYYLDYETVQAPIPVFDGTRPYQQIPFQFSLHVQQKQRGRCKHISFIHQERSDPRRALAESLIANCGEIGSIIAYNASFEKVKTNELAKEFPDLADKLHAITERIVDQLVPFQKRYLYSYKQQGSASIKHVLPAFSNRSYKGMDIANGEEATAAYLSFLEGKQNSEESSKMFKDLETYCGQDTYAMVLLMDVLYKYTNI